MHYTITRRVITHEGMSPAEAILAIDKVLAEHNIKPLRVLRQSILYGRPVPALERIASKGTPVCKACGSSCQYKTTRIRHARRTPNDFSLQMVDGYDCLCCKQEKGKAGHNATVLPDDSVPAAQIHSEVMEAQLENDPEAAFCYDANYLHYEILPRLIGALAGLYRTAGAFFIRLLDNTHYKQGGKTAAVRSDCRNCLYPQVACYWGKRQLVRLGGAGWARDRGIKIKPESQRALRLGELDFVHVDNDPFFGEIVEGQAVVVIFDFATLIVVRVGPQVGFRRVKVELELVVGRHTEGF